MLGHPIAHSQSPFIHAAFARATRQPLHYGRLLCPLDDFEGAVRAFAGASADADGTPGPARGCNVTMPFKFQAYELASRRSERARLARAANTLRFDPDGWLADNTDGAGLVRDIEVNAGVPIRGARVLLLGAGGAAAGVLGPLLRARPALLQIVNRTAERAQALAGRHAEVAAECAVELAGGGIGNAAAGFDIVVNASSSSLNAAEVPLPGSVLRSGALALDMMYGSGAERFMQWAARHGASGRDGLGMLVEQAAESFELWRGIRPPTDAVLADLRQRLSSAAK